MGRLTYGMMTSLDGFVNGPDGTFGWAEPDEETHRFANEREREVGTFLYGRRMFETMRFWADDEALAGAPPYILDYADIWRTATKVVFSSTMDEPALERTRVERRFDPEAVRALKESSSQDLAVAGPTLAAQMLRAGLVDEISVFIAPVVVGGGTRFLPEQAALDLSLVQMRRFDSGFVFLRYAVRH
ncbi:Dihydrofolate reductase [Raineyella antarctica]|uniref:Dihydrofolate reductase n=1 Tax=Raineyella antarctica TaxID=1577474 RepID=A0A1G6GCR3_9ACTN|nr:dihydrofolate reductase family protein [Raineyella antarctica]SDB79777.1 Dihydrofolate reductase [Raineyella antarctica]